MIASVAKNKKENATVKVKRYIRRQNGPISVETYYNFLDLPITNFIREKLPNIETYIFQPFNEDFMSLIMNIIVGLDIFWLIVYPRRNNFQLNSPIASGNLPNIKIVTLHLFIIQIHQQERQNKIKCNDFAGKKII